MQTSSSLMKEKKGLIMGVANNRSLAWGIARSLSEHGAEIALTYQGEALGKRVKPLADSINSKLVIPCDVSDNKTLESTFVEIKKHWGKLINYLYI